MNQGTQKKIVKALEKLGKTASWNEIVAKSGVSKHTVQKYFQESAPAESAPATEQVVMPEVVTEAWDGRRRPLLAMIGYLSSAMSPLSEGRPLSRVPDYTRPICLISHV